MVSILAFSNRCMEYLLDEKYHALFQSTYPIFYKNKISKGEPGKDKYYYRSALDTALRHEQMMALSEILKYICKF